MTGHRYKKRTSSDRDNSEQTILVVEDDQALLKVLVNNLGRAGFHTEGVVSGSEAIERVAKDPPALLLLDYRLQDMTGEQVIKSLTRLRCRVPFIITTGQGDEQIAVAMMKLGARDYLTKDTTFLERLPREVRLVIEQLATEKRLAEAEESLRESERKYRQLFEFSSDALILIDVRTGRILDLNSAALKMYGYSRDKALWMRETDFSAEPHQPGLSALGREQSMSVHMHRKKDGTVFPVEITSGYFVWDGSEVCIATLRDITERRHSEESLREAWERYRAIFEQAAESIVLVDAETGVLVEFNQRAHINLGYPRKEFSKLKIQDFEFFESPGEITEHIRRIAEEGADSFETKHRTKDGDTRNVHVSARVISVGGRQFILSIWRDITEAKQAEEELRRSREEMRNLSAHARTVREEERTSIAREIHDELGQALTALKMDLAWLASEFPEGQEQLLERMGAMNKIINGSIQTVKKLSTRLRPGVLDDLGIAAALEWQAEEFQKRTGIRCSLRVEPEDVAIDREVATAVFRVFQEALTNITRHASASRVSTTFKRESDGLVLRVRDNGGGIDKQQIESSTAYGLIGMRERAYFIGGELEIKRVRSGGTEVLLRAPLHGRGEPCD
ncbi:MAG: PAS domain S-box protein [Dehalococcoidales bacterium]|nr:PAS domain S-box protein [Dehalococcoidales bacterium]